MMELAPSKQESAAKRAAAWEPETGSILDPFHIEDLLDFSNEDIAGPIGEELVGVAAMHQNSSSAAAPRSAVGPAALEHGNEFAIDCDEMPELEWLSSLVDDDSFAMNDELHKSMFIGSKENSFSSPIAATSIPAAAAASNKRSHLLLDDITTTTTTTTTSSKDRFQVGSPISVLESSSATSGSRGAGKDSAVPGRPRSKRLRASAAWNHPSSSSSPLITPTAAAATIDTVLTANPPPPPPIAAASPATSSISDKDRASSEGSVYDQDAVESSSAAPPPPPPPPLCNTNKAAAASAASIACSSSGKPPLLLKSSSPSPSPSPSPSSGCPSPSLGPSAVAEVQPRRCTHCLSQKTPQWRAGPEGPKTLCNACGVRFKSGRLFPEYRPALSPTFVSEVHSNSHRKVLEMRRQKETHQRPCPSPSPSPSSASPGGEVLDGSLIYNVVQS